MDSYITVSHAARTNDGRAVHTWIMEHDLLEKESPCQKAYGTFFSLKIHV